MSAASDLSAAIETCLKQISLANGYATALQGVYGFGERVPDGSAKPLLLVRVAEDEAVERKGPVVRRHARYQIEAVFSRGASLQALQSCQYDILRSLGYGDLPPGRALQAAEIVEESAEFDPDTDGSLQRSVVLSITLQYFERY